MLKLAGNQKSAHVTQNFEDEPKKFGGCEKISAEHENVFGDDLRKIGKPNKILGSEENIFGHFIIFRELKKEYSEAF